jgi:hypothetical protein
MEKVDYQNGFYGFESKEYAFDSIEKIIDDIQKSGVWNEELINALKTQLELEKKRGL